MSGFGGESSFSFGQIERKNRSMSYRRYLKRVLKRRDWVDVSASSGKQARAYLICFSEDFEYGIVDYLRMKNEQEICGRKISIRKFQWRITEEPCVLGQVDGVIGRNILSKWEKQIVADNKERLRDININRTAPDNRRNFDREIKFRKAFELLIRDRNRLENCK